MFASLLLITDPFRVLCLLKASDEMKLRFDERFVPLLSRNSCFYYFFLLCRDQIRLYSATIIHYISPNSKPDTL